MILVFDTETNGKAEFRLPPEHPSQPRMVQLAACLYDMDTQKLRASMNCIIQPTPGAPWTIPPHVEAIHGITTTEAVLYGIPLSAALAMFMTMAKRAVILSAFNAEFDRIVVGGELHRCSYKVDDVIPKEKLICSMAPMTNVCKLPGPYGFKWPKLTEAHKHLFGTDVEGAHDALADTQAAAKVLFWLLANDPAVRQKYEVSKAKHELTNTTQHPATPSSPIAPSV